MKRIALLLVGCCLVINAEASQRFCGYRDFFHLSDSTHPGIFIVSANSSYDLYLQVIGPRSFEIRDTEQCRSGYAHVIVAYDLTNGCVLDIKDGPYMMHPTVSASCHGLKFNGISYDGFNSYSYSLNFG